MLAKPTRYPVSVQLIGVVAVVGLSSCTQIAGLDKDFVAAATTSSAAGGTGGGTTTATGSETGGAGGQGGQAEVNKLSSTFDGVDEWVDMGDVYDFADGAPFSVMLWFKTTIVQDKFLVGKRLLGGNKTGWQMALNGPPARISIDIQESSSSRIDITVPTAVPFDGQWHHLGFSYDGSRQASGCIIYLDGQSLVNEVHVDTLSGGFTSAAPFTLGARNGTGKWFNGNLDEVTIYAAALSAAEVVALYNGGTPTDPSKLPSAGQVVGWWTMGDGDTFPVVSDQGPFFSHGVMKNMEAEDFVADTPP